MNSNYHMDPYAFILCEVTLQFREAFLIYFALPCISEVTEVFDSFSRHISLLNCYIDIINNNNINNTINSPTHISQSQTEYQPLEYPSQSQLSLITNINQRVCNINVWISTIERPLIMYVLGRKIKKKEVRVQLITFAVLALGSFGSYIIGRLMASY